VGDCTAMAGVDVGDIQVDNDDDKLLEAQLVWWEGANAWLRARHTKVDQ
jgi:hypothetical protein